jgi:NADP-dependent 3-hydroxy acid dehydrogenase YdfG
MKLNRESVIALTGASRGIGRATALALGGRGVRLGLLARSGEGLCKLEGELGALGAAGMLSRVGDVRDRATTDGWIDAILEKWGRLDALINNAGVGIMKPVGELTDEDWAAMIETNLTGPFRLIRRAIEPMRRAGGGHIINVSSMAGEVGFAGGGGYCASKFGLQGLSECLIHEVRRDGIKVTILGPGSVDTRFDAKNPDADAAWKIVPEEIARTIVFLLESPDNTMVTKLQIRPTLKGKK